MSDFKRPQRVWSPISLGSTAIEAFRKMANENYGLQMENYHDVWTWSTTRINDFWMLVWSFTRVLADVEPTYAIGPSETARLWPRPAWFPEARLNYARNILESAMASTSLERVVVTGIREDSVLPEHVTLRQLRRRVGHLSNALRSAGVVPGDRVATLGANSIDTFVIFLSSAAVGAIFTSCSPETGERAILDRFLQVRPRILFAEDAQIYNGKTTRHISKIVSIANALQAEGATKCVVVIPRLGKESSARGSDRLPESMTYLDSFVADAASRIIFESMRFDDPLLLVYSSGTTGQPKCIVHSVGGVLLKQKAEQILGCDMGPDSVHFQYSTTSWIMYMYSVSSLLSGARSILYDGSPTKPSMVGFLRVLGDCGITHFGTSAHYLHLLQDAGINKTHTSRLDRLQVITSTGSILTESQYHWVYTTFGDIQLSSIAGGTDIAGAFVGGSPNLPVYAGYCQGRALGMKVQIFGETGEAVEHTGQPGELVCTAPFPSQPLYFWNDPSGLRHHSAYFEKFKGIWTQGDYIRMDPTTQGVQFLGRSDGVLNPSGIRFGSSEIYNLLSNFHNIEESLCIGQRRPHDTNERVLLFLKMKQDCDFDDGLARDIRLLIREQLSPKHVPSYIGPTPDIPMTVNGKKTELPVKKIVSGQNVEPSSTIVNPQSLEWYRRFAKEDCTGQKDGKSAAKL